MEAIQKIIDQFSSISLKKMDNVKLLNRVDTKFLCPVGKIHEILHDLVSLYKVLEISDERIMSYRTKYYDTENFKMFREHQNGKLNRYKIREREYLDSDLKFLEIKFKSNKRRTLKSRIIKPENTQCFNNKEIDFLDYKSPFSSDELEVKLVNTFKRLTLTNGKERITVDFDLKFISANGNVGMLPSLVIVEVKQEKFSMESKVIQVLKEHGIRSASFSKYCIGATLVYTNLKSNRFKSKILMINKISA